MTARDEIFKRLAGAFISEEKANALIDAYAHELAEKIRNDRTVYAFGPPEQEAYANLIDPEVS